MAEHLVVMDMQEKFMEYREPEDVAAAVLVIQGLITLFRAQEKNIVYPMFPENRFGKILNALAPRPEEIMEKEESDAYICTDFSKRIPDRSVIHMTGCNLDVCVRLTVESALRHHCKVVVHKDGVLRREGYDARNKSTLRYFLLSPSIQVISGIPKKRY